VDQHLDTTKQPAERDWQNRDEHAEDYLDGKPDHRESDRLARMEAYEFILAVWLHVEEDYPGHEETDVGKRGDRLGLSGGFPIHPRSSLSSAVAHLSVVEGERPAQSAAVQ